MTSYFQDGSHDVISHRKVLPSVNAHAAARSVCPCPAHM